MMVFSNLHYKYIGLTGESDFIQIGRHEFQ